MKRTRDRASVESSLLYRRALALYNGQGVRRDVGRAFAAMEEAAKSGHIEAHAALGAYYDYGVGVTPDPELALKHYRIAARAGDADAQYNVAACAYEGIGTRRNYKTAVTWLQKAVVHRVPDANFLLGCCYEHGRGVSKDLARAARLYLAAARAGHADANVEVGFHLHARSPKKAVGWYRKGARLGSAAGQYNLANCLERGYGVRRNLRLARTWYGAAAKQGHEKALRALKALESPGLPRRPSRSSRRDSRAV